MGKLDNYHISRQIKTLRLAAGLSRQALARAADTSLPTIYRYENGWDRFEVNTLRKIATALGREIRITFEPAPSHEAPPAPLSGKALAALLRPLFWDRKLRGRDLARYPEWVIVRILELGDLPQVRALDDYYGREKIAETVGNSRQLSPRTREFWIKILRLRRPACTRKSFPREATAYWKS